MPTSGVTRFGRHFRALVAVLALSLPAAGCGGSAGTEPSATNDPTPTGDVSHGRLVFRDEFDGTSLNTETWTPHRDGDGDATAAPFNTQSENAVFAPGQVTVADGNLRLRAEKRARTISGQSYAYTSGVVQSRGHQAMHFGYIEFRLKTPTDTGYWPAAWLVGVANPVSEIDVVEFAHADDGHYGPLSNVHWGTDWEHAHEWGWQALGNTGTSYTGQWHTYGARWDRGRLQTYLDGKPGPVMTGDAVPNESMYLVLNLSITKSANPPADSLYVDYVRIWD